MIKFFSLCTVYTPQRAVVALLIAGLSSLVLWLHVSGLRINLSASVPWVMVQMQPLPMDWRDLRGRLVLACPPNDAVQSEARKRGYVPWGIACPGHFAPLLKYVGGLPGDLISQSSAGLVINGRLLPNTRPLHTDSVQQTLPYPASSGVVPDGMIWVVSTDNGGSWDSRYYGAIPLANLQGLAVPVMVQWHYAMPGIITTKQDTNHDKKKTVHSGET